MSRWSSKFHLSVETDPQSPAADAYRKLRTNFEFSTVDRNIRTLMVSAATAGEGVSSTAANLAASYAHSERNVLLIDANLRAPSLHSMFQVKARHGLTSLLSFQCKPKDALLPLPIDNLTLLPAGPAGDNFPELLASRRLPALLAELKETFDLIVIDAPPLLGAGDAQALAAQCDGVILVILAGKVKKAAAVKAVESLTLVKAQVLGAVMNKVKRKKAGRY